jgi:phosphate transport system protein
MVVRLQREIEKLKRMIVQLSTQVEEAVYNSVKSVSDRDIRLAERVIENDVNIDQMEIDVEEECLKILALHQPVAVDLRFLVAVLKMNNDLERIGDLAVNIAKGAEFLGKRESVVVPYDYSGMSAKVQVMLRTCLDAMINLDKETARKVLAMDDEIDDIHRDMYKRIGQEIEAHPECADRLLRMMAVSKKLERIADHTTNIAEDIIYMVDGEIVRHQLQ